MAWRCGRSLFYPDVFIHCLLGLLGVSWDPLRHRLLSQDRSAEPNKWGKTQDSCEKSLEKSWRIVTFLKILIEFNSNFSHKIGVPNPTNSELSWGKTQESSENCLEKSWRIVTFLTMLKEFNSNWFNFGIKICSICNNFSFCLHN